MVLVVAVSLLDMMILMAYSNGLFSSAQLSWGFNKGFSVTHMELQQSDIFEWLSAVMCPFVSHPNCVLLINVARTAATQVPHKGVLLKIHQFSPSPPPHEIKARFA